TAAWVSGSSSTVRGVASAAPSVSSSGWAASGWTIRRPRGASVAASSGPPTPSSDAVSSSVPRGPLTRRPSASGTGSAPTASRSSAGSTSYRDRHQAGSLSSTASPDSMSTTSASSTRLTPSVVSAGCRYGQPAGSSPG